MIPKSQLRSEARARRKRLAQASPDAANRLANHADALLDANLIPTGHDSAGDLRAVELLDHPFFVATLFQPERAALKGITPPLAIALLKACQEVSA